MQPPPMQAPVQVITSTNHNPPSNYEIVQEFGLVCGISSCKDVQFNGNSYASIYESALSTMQARNWLLADSCSFSSHCFSKQQAVQRGGNAVLGIRITSSWLGPLVHGVLQVYGTACLIRPRGNVPYYPQQSQYQPQQYPTQNAPQQLK